MTVNIESAQWPGVFLRMDGTGVTSPDGAGGGVVNCQFTAGAYEKFNIVNQADGTVNIESAQWPGVFLRMDGTGVTSPEGAGGGVVNCQFTAGAYEKFNIVNVSSGGTVLWPVHGDSGDTIIGSSGNGHMDTTVSIDQTGNLQASTHTWDTSGWGFLTGFHGAGLVVIFDSGNNPLGQFSSPAYGVEGGQSRVDQWTGQLSAAAINGIAKMAVTNIYNPQYSFFNNLWQWVVANKDTLIAIATAVEQVASA
jgi:hypothetical protein